MAWAATAAMLVTACSPAASPASTTTVTTAAALSGDPIKIGVLQDASGPGTFSSSLAVGGLKTAADAIQNGQFFWGAPPATSGKPGILGRPIQLMLEDTQSNPNQALLATQKLISNGAVAIIGTTSSPDALQARVACKEASVPCLFLSLSAAAIVQPPNNEYAFTASPNFDIQAAQLVKALAAADKKNVSIVEDDGGASATVAMSFVNAFSTASVPVKSTEVIPASAQDVTSQVESLKAQKPDAVIDLIAVPTINALFVKQLKSSGLGTQLYGINPLVNPQVRSQIGPAVDGAVVMDQMDRSSPDVIGFTRDYQALNGADKEVTSNELYMMTSLLVLKKAMEDATSTNGPAVKAALENITNFPAGFGVKGYKMSWSPTDHNGSKPGAMVFVVYKGQQVETWPVYQPPTE
jgi:branched-chain amino acid transport system substrate-binding protein